MPGPPSSPAPQALSRPSGLLAALLALLALGALATGVSAVRFALAVRALEARHATGPSWSFPSRVTSADLPLVAGSPMPPAYLAAELEAREYHQVAGTPHEPGTWAARAGGLELLLRGSDGGPERVRVRLANARIGDIVRMGGLPGAPAPDTAHAPALEPVLLAVATDSARVCGASGCRSRASRSCCSRR